jgi:hypothetical protein
MRVDQLPVGAKVEMVLKKFDGDVPAGCEDPEAAGFRLAEEITIVYEGDVKVSETRRVF